jgi:hypothetical protein
MRVGDYGIHIKLIIQKLNENNEIIFDRMDLYFSATRDMIGNPYAFRIYTE